MARGWESKAVEHQQADERPTGARGAARSPEEQERVRRIDTLRLALADVTAQLQAACRPAHRDMLQHRLDAIRSQIDALGDR